MPPFVIFTDLDGTLLNEAYSFAPALPALRALRDGAIPCVICSSKTRAEIEHYRERLSNHDPFISENGGAIFLPPGYFPTALSDLGLPFEEDPMYHIVRLGTPYAALRAAMAGLRSEGFEVRGFGDMTPEEVAQVTGLDVGEARMAKDREYDEPFLFEGDDAATADLMKTIEAKGLHYAEGQLFYHLMGSNDKGKAVSMLDALYTRAQTGEIWSVALGDGPNDLPMLEAVDIPIIVRQPGGRYDRRFEGKPFVKADGVGPEGWNRAVLKLLRGGPFEL